MVPHQKTTVTSTERSQRNSEDNKSTDEKLLFVYSKGILYGNARFEEIRHRSSHFDEDVIYNEDVFREKCYHDFR